MLPLKEKPVSQTLVTDAFMTGWGAHLGQMQVSGVWARDLALQHTHYLEMMAVFLAIQYFQNSMRDQKVLVKTDNTTVMTYIKKGGRIPHPYAFWYGTCNSEPSQQHSLYCSTYSGKSQHIGRSSASKI